MAHFAQIDNNNIVINVIVAEQDFINSGAVGDASLWIQTSYNSRIRKNFAGNGYTYDSTRDAFIPPKPYPSWVLNEDTCNWESPVLKPNNGLLSAWNEETLTWVEYNG